MTDSDLVSKIKLPLSWGLVLGVWLGFMFVVGGTSVPSRTAQTVQSCGSAILAVLAAWRLHKGFPNRLALSGWALLAVGFTFALAQLIPLPPSIWQALPGRDLIRETMALTNQDLPWLPITLAPDQTSAVVLAFIPVFAGFLATLSLRNQDFFHLASGVVTLALCAVILGLLQKTGRAPDVLYFYNSAESRVAAGTFGNRNFLAAQIFASLPFLAVVSTSVQRRQRSKPLITLLFVFIYMAIMLAGLAVVGSRGGVLLAMPSVLFTLLFVYRPQVSGNRLKSAGLASFGVIAGLTVMSQASILGILRLIESEPLEDFRNTIFDVSWSAMKGFWPVGSGFGSFVNVYQMYETPEAILDRYVNAAHNDWLQLVLEGGLIAAILCGIFILLFSVGLVRTFKNNLNTDEHSAAVRAGSLTVALMATHALFDFGLRTPALLSLFSIACGLVCLSGRREVARWQMSKRQKSDNPAGNGQPPIRPAKDPNRTYFKVQPPQ